ncbi:hypothetical protein PsYK624_093480 [Phanerochaete sordida]|uniref:Uncharacterized protein n=1 Tax=Phanerochaete sordida TaxID=48140 RepID=A0A9P3LG11_9APHY|nr:hypothetical protein PsYK624_093480 [Phanerochaete sordida]
MSTPTLPTAVAGPRQNITVSIIYEDSASPTNSFITAPSMNITDTSSNVDFAHGSEAYEEDDLGDGDMSNPFDDRHEPYAEDRHEDTEHSHMSLPSGLYDIEPGPQQCLSTPATSHLLALDQHSAEGHPQADEHSVFDTMSRRSHTSEGTAVESMIQRRWLQGLSYGSFRGEDRTWKPEDESNHQQYTSARILFWLGFIMPWCWLIGGWCLARSGEAKHDEEHTKPMWWELPGRTKAKGIVKPAKESTSKKARSPFWRFHARNQETTPISPVDNDSVRTIRSMVEEKQGHPQFIDPWVQRCRVAASLSGGVLCALVVVCIVAFAVYR